MLRWKHPGRPCWELPGKEMDIGLKGTEWTSVYSYQDPCWNKTVVVNNIMYDNIEHYRFTVNAIGDIDPINLASMLCIVNTMYASSLVDVDTLNLIAGVIKALASLLKVNPIFPVEPRKVIDVNTVNVLIDWTMSSVNPPHMRGILSKADVIDRANWLCQYHQWFRYSPDMFYYVLGPYDYNPNDIVDLRRDPNDDWYVFFYKYLKLSRKCMAIFKEVNAEKREEVWIRFDEFCERSAESTFFRYYRNIISRNRHYFFLNTMHRSFLFFFEHNV